MMLISQVSWFEEKSSIRTGRIWQPHARSALQQLAERFLLMLRKAGPGTAVNNCKRWRHIGSIASFWCLCSCFLNLIWQVLGSLLCLHKFLSMLNRVSVGSQGAGSNSAPSSSFTISWFSVISVFREVNVSQWFLELIILALNMPSGRVVTLITCLHLDP